MGAHTPGPWVVFNSPREDQEIVGVTSQAEMHMDSDGDGADICQMSNNGYFSREEVEANARLIASAPSLLAEREALRAALSKCIRQFENMDEHLPTDAGCIECTAGTVPNHLNTGLCGYHAAKAVVGGRKDV